MAATKKRAKATKKWTKRKKIGLAVMALTAISILAVAYVLSLPKTSVENRSLAQAVLIDQLSITYPNNTFYWTTQSLLNQRGIQVSYNEGVFNTIDFFRKVPSYNYTIVILRVHSAMDPETGNLAIFTGEKWSDSKARWDYLADIIAERIVRLRVEENSTAYFGITPAFITSMDGNLKGAVIIMMGCDGLTNQNMAKAFIEKGGKVYISWTGLVSSEHTDAATLTLIQHLFAEGKTVEEAVAATNNEMDKDPIYGSELAWYPADEGDYVINIP